MTFLKVFFPGIIPKTKPVPRRHASNHSTATSVKSMTPSIMMTYPLYTCHLVYLGCRDCDLSTGSEAVDKAISKLLTANHNFANSSLVEMKLLRSGITLTDEARKLFFRKHFSKRQMVSCEKDPRGRTVNVAAYFWGLRKISMDQSHLGNSNFFLIKIFKTPFPVRPPKRCRTLWHSPQSIRLPKSVPHPSRS